MWQQIKRWTRRSAADESGQSMVIIAVAFVALLVIIGLAIDLGLMYIERIKLGRACDAAALAAAQDLPFEEFAARRAVDYLTENGYDPNNSELVVLSSDSGALSLAWPAPADSKGTITIDMESYEDEEMDDVGNSADKIRVHGRIQVPMNFMKLVGFATVPVEAQAIAENVSNLDIAIVLDESGSMNDDTYCYRDGERPCYKGGENYPAGERLYVPWADWITEPVDPLVYDGREILVAEAEYFSYSTSFAEHPYYRDYYQWPNTFWMIQRTEDSQASGYRYEYNDRRGAHLMHMPHRDDIEGHRTASSAAPRLDYNFHIPEPIGIPSQWYIWIRAQCGNWSGNSSRVDGCVMHWGVDGTHLGSIDEDDFDPGSGVDKHGGRERGSNNRYWEWIRLGSVTQTDRNVQINIWGGGPGFRLDKVIITRHSEGQQPNSSSVDDHAPLFIQGTTPDWDSNMKSRQYQYYEYGEWFAGPADTKGRDGMAASKCNPIYGLRVNDGCTPGQAPDAGCEDLDGNGTVDYYEICDNTLDDMWDDQQPIRDTKEAGKKFLMRLRARFDQVGFVGYSSSYNNSLLRELNCLKLPPKSGLQSMPDDEGVWDPQTGPDPAWTWCYDRRTSSDGYSGNDRRSGHDYGSIWGAIEAMDAGGNTNIAEGMREALELLETTSGHYGRPNAVKVMVLLTDGVANRWPGYSSCGSGSCCEEDLYQPNVGASYEQRAADCVIYYARQAKDEGVVIYTIGLGLGAQGELLETVADETGGLYYFAPKGKDLDWIFQQIADQIFLRLVE